MELIPISKFPPNTSILVKEDFLKELKNKVSSEDRALMNQNFRGFRNLRNLLYLCTKYKIPFKDLNNSILSYRTTGGRVTIVNPKLPVRVTPIFDMLIAHGIGDGFCSHIENRMAAFIYRQSRNEIIDLFVKKMESVFGNVVYKKSYFYEQKHVYMPSVLSYILYSHYSLEPRDFLENESRIPHRILDKDKDHLVAVLIAFILDEGSVDSSNIIIGLYNKALLNDIKIICDKLGYGNTLKFDRHGRGYIYILSDGTKKFWGDYLRLKIKYPEISLEYKERLIENFIIRKEKVWRTSRQGETQNIIIELLKRSDMTVKELSVIMKMSRQGTKYHLRQLENMNVIRRVGKGYAGSDVYRLINYIVLPIKRKGRSRQYSITSDRIIDYLKGKTMTTKEIALKIDVNMNTTFQFLVNLERGKRIKRVGKKVHKTHPSIVWSIDN